MIWANPWALLGLAAIAVPVLLHLLSRRKPKLIRFPTLRFFGEAQILPRRRARITDVPLMLIRAAILALAALALAQPVVLTRDRTAAAARVLTRAILVDTSASMHRAAAGGPGTLVDSARAMSRALLAEANVGLVLETPAVAVNIAGAGTWLRARGGAGELVVVSDFQTGTVDSLDLAGLPPEIGVRLVRIGAADTTRTIERRLSRQPGVVARVAASDDRTSVEWVHDGRADTERAVVRTLAGDSTTPAADAVARAVGQLGGDVASRLPIVVVFPDFAGRDRLIAEATPFNQPWMGDAAVEIGRDPTLVAAALLHDDGQFGAGGGDAAQPEALTVLVRDRERRPALLAASGRVEDRESLLLFARAAPSTDVGAAAIAAAARVGTRAVPPGELDPIALSHDALARWERESRPVVGTERMAANSDGRWLWVGVLGLLALEHALRRRRREEPEISVTPREQAVRVA